MQTQNLDLNLNIQFAIVVLSTISISSGKLWKHLSSVMLQQLGQKSFDPVLLSHPG